MLSSSCHEIRGGLNNFHELLIPGNPAASHSPLNATANPEEFVDMLLEGESSRGRCSSGQEHAAVAPQAAGHHAPWEGFSLERSSVPSLKEKVSKAIYQPQACRVKWMLMLYGLESIYCLSKHSRLELSCDL